MEIDARSEVAPVNAHRQRDRRKRHPVSVDRIRSRFGDCAGGRNDLDRRPAAARRCLARSQRVRRLMRDVIPYTWGAFARRRDHGSLMFSSDAISLRPQSPVPGQARAACAGRPQHGGVSFLRRARHRTLGSAERDARRWQPRPRPPSRFWSGSPWSRSAAAPASRCTDFTMKRVLATLNGPVGSPCVSEKCA